LALEGGWYAVLRVPATPSDAARALSVPSCLSDEDLALHLLQSHGVYLHPGHYFDFPSGNHLVLSLLNASNEFQLAAKFLLSVV
jgi:alanine-synthesizing transaminase